MEHATGRRMHIVRRRSFTTMPWKNGGGVTHEAFRVPAGTDEFLWRVSVAEIEAGGPFSDFPGCERTMVLLRGAGLRLDFADGGYANLVAIGDRIDFDGGVAATCRLLAGPCVDLNLIVRRSLQPVRAAVLRVAGAVRTDLHHADGAVEAARQGVRIGAHPLASAIFCIEGSVRLEAPAGGAAMLHAWDLAVIEPADGDVSIHAVHDRVRGDPAAGDPAAGDPAAGDPAAGDPAVAGAPAEPPPLVFIANLGDVRGPDDGALRVPRP